jgi:hypothetical protein
MRARRVWSEWASIIGEYERSGESHEAFCSGRGLNVGTFRAWLYRLRKASPLPEVALLPVELAKSAAPLTRALAPQATDVIVALGVVEVRFAVGTDVQYVGALVGKLRSRC